MDQMVKVSVIMLTYNRETLVGRAIESILAQSMEDFEYIIVDNGSTDKSGEIAEEYAKKDARIRVLHIPKSNIGTGRNAGLDAAKGEYVTFIDDDDTAEPDMLEFLYGKIKQDSYSVYENNLLTTLESGVKYTYYKSNYKDLLD